MNMDQYLKYIVYVHGVHVDLANIQFICCCSSLKTLIEIQIFLGLSNFYRRFVLGFSHILCPFIQVAKGGWKEKIVWSKTK
jgi:hypothetical protein